MPEPLFFIDDWIEELSNERKLICVQRAARSIGIPVELNPDGSLVLPELTGEGAEALDEALGEEFKRMFAVEMTAELVEDGKIIPDYVNADGVVEYVIA